MPALRIACALPDGINLPADEYGQDDPLPLIIDGGSAPSLLSVVAISPPFVLRRSQRVSTAVIAADGLDDEERDAFQFKAARRLLYRLNLLIRWYRAEMQATAIHELTLAQAGPFLFHKDPGGDLWGEFRASPVVVPALVSGSAKEALVRIRQGFASAQEPPVESLLFLDARQALYEGRFREAVLFCWSVIDGTFNQRFESLVKLRLGEEWKESREFLVSNDFGLRHKMGLGMRLAVGRSLFKEPDDFWSKLDRSYKSRNKIIHEGAIASEEDAHLAIWVAQRVVDIMKSL